MSKSYPNNPHPTISIIMPVYNVGSYIEKSLASVINQTYKNIEILIIDDCGHDCSMNIVNKFQKYDSRIKIIKNKQNLGLGKSRNIGIQESKGKYLLFVDTDDYLKLNTLEKLHKQTTKTDVDYVGYNHIKIWENSEKIVYHHFNNFLDKYFQSMSSWTKLYKKSFLIKNDIKFETFRCAEDMCLGFKVFAHAKKYSWIDFDGYYYLQRQNSLSYPVNEENDKKIAIGVIKALKKIEEFLLNNKENKHFNFLFDKFQCIKMEYLCTHYLRRHPKNRAFYIAETKRYLTDYPKNYEEFLQKIQNPKLEEYLKELEPKIEKKKIILYGFNDFAILLHHHFYKNISAIIDKNKHGEVFQNHIIQNLENLPTYQDETFVITAINNAYIKDIKKNILYKFPKAKVIHLPNDSRKHF